MYVRVCCVSSLLSTVLHSRVHTVSHCRIHNKMENGRVRYYLIEQACFDSLYELITHYQSNPLRSQQFEQVLTEAIGKVCSIA